MLGYNRISPSEPNLAIIKVNGKIPIGFSGSWVRLKIITKRSYSKLTVQFSEADFLGVLYRLEDYVVCIMHIQQQKQLKRACLFNAVDVGEN